MLQVQVISAEISPSSGSVAVPEKVTRSPTTKLSPSDGEDIVNVGEKSSLTP